MERRGGGLALGLPASQSTAPTAPVVAPTAKNRPDWAHGPTGPVVALPQSNGQPADPADTVHCLWRDEFVKILECRLSLAESLSQVEGPLKLAVTLPCPSARAVVRGVLERYEYEAPSIADFTPGWLGAITDPGLMLMVKELPRKGSSCRRPEPRTPREQHASPGYHPALSRAVHGGRQVQARVREGRRLVDPAVTNGGAELVRAAAPRWLAQSEHSREAACDLAGELPFRLRPNCRTTAVYHTPWPGRLAGKVPEAVRRSAGR